MITAEHARHALRGARVDAADDAVRVAAAHHHRISLALEIEVVGVAALRRAPGSGPRCAARAGRCRISSSPVRLRAFVIHVSGRFRLLRGSDNGRTGFHKNSRRGSVGLRACAVRC